MRAVAGLLLLIAAASAAEDSWAKADRTEFLGLLQDIERAGDAVWVAQARRLQRLYDGDAWVEGIRSTTEVHGVALVRGKRATVHVTRRGPAITLILAAHDPVEWTVTTGDGARVVRALYFGNRGQRVNGLGAGQVGYGGTSFVLNPRETAYTTFARAARTLLKGKRIETYVGLTTARGGAIEVGPGSALWRRQMLRQSMRRLHERATRRSAASARRDAERHVSPIIAWTHGGSRVFCDATPRGIVSDSQMTIPRGAFAVAVDPESGHRYFLTQTEIVVQGSGGRDIERIPLPAWLGRRGWAADIVFDARRRRIIAVNIGGGMGAYSIRTRTWETLGQEVRLNGRVFRVRSEGILTALAWDAGRDGFWSLHVRGRDCTLRAYTAQGVRGSSAKFRLPLNLQAGARNGTEIAVVQGYVAIFAPTWAARRKRETTRCFLVEPVLGRIVADNRLRPIGTLPVPQPGELPALWEQLGGADPYSAILRLSRGREAVVAYMTRRWDEMPVVGEEEFRNTLVALDSTSAYARSYAFAQLSRSGPAMCGRLETEIERQDSPEVRMALRRIVDDIRSGPDIAARMDRVLANVPGAAARTLRLRLRPAAK